MSSHLVFVYGSLKRGFHNAPVLEDAHFLGAATTVDSYLMLSGSAFPFLINPEALTRQTDLTGFIGNVRGEVYSVDVETLARLDRLEGHPRFYKREQVSVRMDTTPSNRPLAWVYFLQADPGQMIARPIMPDASGFVEWTKGNVSAAYMMADLAAPEGEE